MVKEVSNEMKEFIADLEVWAVNWVEKVQQVVVDHLDELYQDSSVRYLAKKYREMSEAYYRFNKGKLLSAYEYNRPVCKHSMSDMTNYSNVLYELCYRRFNKPTDE